MIKVLGQITKYLDRGLQWIVLGLSIILLFIIRLAVYIYALIITAMPVLLFILIVIIIYKMCNK